MDYTQTILDFLKEIGIPTEEVLLDSTTFLPGVQIKQGKLHYDPTKLEFPGDLIHEAGHIALMTQEERKTIIGNVKEYRNPAQDDEMGVLAWSYAAIKHLGIPGELLFHEGGYHGQAQALLRGFESGQILGLPLLVWMELTDYDTYPEMRKWIRE
ncbi:hypothetical protein PBT90_12155 [Algoriphagus halophytocola]|uniref:ImmA/IrrE family metallo-endopeptidase n=1 Tax=Algoriphagus halophytocola TaxID=2991499 RepID=A0ABY6MK30_9BACT|nr:MULTISPECIES: hypothetical protein [unclassified Algoriphagus]UZD24137.1 hypothetical protein OM944_06465 [Algoriphagus sp. TR-M5]WBL41508.1 hypothetical protein PBT90_12155 [Algoriphagus sp. TR-M9]